MRAMTKINDKVDCNATWSQRRYVEVKIGRHHLLAVYNFSKRSTSLPLYIKNIWRFTKESHWILIYKNRTHLWCILSEQKSFVCSQRKILLYHLFNIHDEIAYCAQQATVLFIFHTNHNLIPFHIIFTFDALETALITLLLHTHT